MSTVKRDKKNMEREKRCEMNNNVILIWEVNNI